MEKCNKTLLGNRITDCREKKGETQKDIQRLLDFNNHQQVSYIENGKEKRNLSLDQLITLAKHFNVSTDYLLGLTDTPVALDTDEQKTVRAASDYTGFHSSYIELVNTIKNSNAITIIDLTERLTEELIFNFKLVDDLASGKTQRPFNFLDIINDNVMINNVDSKESLERILMTGERDISQYIAHITIIKNCIEKTIDEYFEIEDINKYYNEYLQKKQNLLDSYNGGENNEKE